MLNPAGRKLSAEQILDTASRELGQKISNCKFSEYRVLRIESLRIVMNRNEQIGIATTGVIFAAVAADVCADTFEGAGAGEGSKSSGDSIG